MLSEPYRAGRYKDRLGLGGFDGFLVGSICRTALIVQQIKQLYKQEGNRMENT